MIRHTILVVDDNPTTRKSVSLALTQRGHRVLGAEGGRTALDLMAREQPVLVLQDLILPDVDGWQLAGELRKRARAKVAVLAFSGFTSRNDEARVLVAGFDDVVIKPIDAARLIPIVEAYLPVPADDSERFGVGLRVLVADDDPIQLKLTRYRLETLGFAVDAASDGEDAMARIRQRLPDVVVSDVLMPRLDGFGLALAVRQDPRLVNLPLVLVTSSYVDRADRDFARRAGANDLVIRTPDLRELTLVLRALLSAPRDPTMLKAHVIPELEKERTRRMLGQLERQVVVNAGLADRCTALSAELAVLAGISEAVVKDQNIESALDIALASCLDASGLSFGAVYLQQPDESFHVRPLGSYVNWTGGALESFFGQLSLLRQIIAEERTVTFHPRESADARASAVLASCAGHAALVVPLIYLDRRMGALFLVVPGEAVEQQDVLIFAQGLGNQIAQALALAAAFTQREAAERRALESRIEWQSLAEQAPDFIVRIDAEGIIQFVNRARAPTNRQDLLGKHWLSSVPVEYHPALAASLRATLSSGEISTNEFMLPGPTGKSEWFSSRIGPSVSDGKITGAIIISRQVTAKKEEEAQLIVADRMASVGTLAAGVAHEINNPLAAVIANLDLAQREAAELAERSGNRDLMDCLKDAQEAAERVRLIVRDLKVFSRIDEDRMGPTDVRSILEATLRMAWNEIRHRARLVKEFAQIPPVEANESRLGQVFLNLIINATHAFPEGQSPRNEIRVTTRIDANGMVAIDVADTGVGMAPDVQKRLFTPFFTTKPIGVGTGLGLSICQKLIGGMGGSIQVESKEGVGSRFTILLSPARVATEVSGDGTPGPVLSPRRRGRLLVIDDEEVVAMAIRRSLSREHDVVYTNTAREALDRLGKAPNGGSEFDVILCDLMMPEMTGMDLYAELMLAFPEQARRMIFVTGGAFTSRAREFLDSVPNMRIEKPFNVQQLRSLVNERVR